ncbi:hypothetical protein AB0C18_34170 [Nonomuraea muscovyensis]|uniref:hypothetical protein n=1 Tax=Nonomuraea muscovyensis TaxID=1124761 RepID=UPI003400F34F|nr:hypothetical protein [Nonomuraea muscovyensis]
MNHAERAMRTDWPSEIDRWLSELSQYGGHHGGFGHPQHHGHHDPHHHEHGSGSAPGERSEAAGEPRAQRRSFLT